VRESLAQAAAAYAAGLAAWAGWCALRGGRRPRLLDGALVVLESAFVLHAVIGAGAIAEGRLADEPAVYGGYLAVSVVLLPAVAAGCGDHRSRWDALVLAIGCVAASAVALRMLAIARG
jgi:hypothetical protein